MSLCSGIVEVLSEALGACQRGGQCALYCVAREKV